MIFHFIALSAALFASDSLQTPYEKSNKQQTTSYQEYINYYTHLDDAFGAVKLLTGSNCDGGKPLHLVVINADGEFDLTKVAQSKKALVFINNGIHPGEPEGIDASMQLARDLVTLPKFKRLLDSVIVCIVPIFNVEGALNTSAYYRVNQNGPQNPAFRGNGQNRDLNRDFIKCDTRNAMALIEFIQAANPDIFIDTHTSNGADYQYVLTYIATQKDKLHPALSAYMTGKFEPKLKSNLNKQGFLLSPYVNEYKTIPDSGIVGFLETPRFSTGYSTLFNMLGFVVETHMLKPFDKRVAATYAFLQNTLVVAAKDVAEIKRIRKQAIAETRTAATFALNYRLDTASFSNIDFAGYQSGYRPSLISGLPRLQYDRNKPFTKKVCFYNTYLPSISVTKPVAYVLPQAYQEVIKRLQLNGVQLQPLVKDTVMKVEVQYIASTQTASNPYEGHYLHYNTTVRTDTQRLSFFAGDVVIYMNQPANRFIAEVLEPQSVDSYFNWNFFDGILNQKEYFSDYVFEDVAADYLKQHPEVRALLEEAKKNNPDLAQSAAKQLDFVYRNSPYYEPSHKRYPVMKLF